MDNQYYTQQCIIIMFGNNMKLALPSTIKKVNLAQIHILWVHKILHISHSLLLTTIGLQNMSCYK